MPRLHPQHVRERGGSWKNKAESERNKKMAKRGSQTEKGERRRGSGYRGEGKLGGTKRNGVRGKSGWDVLYERRICFQ